MKPGAEKWIGEDDFVFGAGEDVRGEIGEDAELLVPLDAADGDRSPPERLDV